MLNVPNHKKGYKSCSKEQELLTSSSWTLKVSRCRENSQKIICKHVLLAVWRGKKKGSLLTNDYCQKVVELTSLNVKWPLIMCLLEALPISPQKGDNYVLFPGKSLEQLKSNLIFTLSWISTRLSIKFILRIFCNLTIVNNWSFIFGYKVSIL